MCCKVWSRQEGVLLIYPESHATAPLGHHSCRGHARSWHRTAVRARTCGALGHGDGGGDGDGGGERRGGAAGAHGGEEGCMGAGRVGGVHGGMDGGRQRGEARDALLRVVLQPVVRRERERSPRQHEERGGVAHVSTRHLPRAAVDSHHCARASRRVVLQRAC